MRNRRGFTLIETLMAIVIVSLLVLIGYPKLSSTMVSTDVRGARTTLANMFTKARSAATTRNRSASVVLAGNQVLVVASPREDGGAGVDTIGAVNDLHATYGVTVTTGGADTITFDPRGIRSLGADDVTISVARSGHTDSLTVDAMGRVRK